MVTRLQKNLVEHPQPRSARSVPVVQKREPRLCRSESKSHPPQSISNVVPREPWYAAVTPVVGLVGVFGIGCLTTVAPGGLLAGAMGAMFLHAGMMFDRRIVRDLFFSFAGLSAIPVFCLRSPSFVAAAAVFAANMIVGALWGYFDKKYSPQVEAA